MTPKELKNSILQLAIEGKLVEQRKEEGSAETLYAEIQKEKQKLIKQGKIKKEKELPEITDEEVPFEIPKSWKWVRLNDIVSKEIKRGKSPKYSNNGKAFAFAQKCNSKHDGIRLELALCLDDTSLKKYTDSDKLIDKDIIINSTGTGTLGRIGLYLNKYNVDKKDYYPDSHVTIIRSLVVEAKYIYVILLCNQKYFEKSGDGSTNQKELKPETLKQLVISLPPLAEQKRIVEKIEELMPLVDRYEVLYNRLNELNKEFPKKLKNAVLQKAIGGKLVPQIKSEGSAEDLYKEIQKEKQKLIKQGKIKKEKELPEITDDEVPFEIPKSWKWVRMGTCCKITTGDKDANYGVNDGKYDFFTCSAIPIKSKTYSFDGESIIAPGNGANVGMAIYYNGKFEAYQRTYVIQSISKVLYVRFLKYAMDWNWKKYNQDKMFGSAIPYIKLGNLQNYTFPLPPFAEQKRIVEKIEEILPNIEKLDKYNQIQS